MRNMTPSQSSAKYNKANTVSFKLILNKKYDADVIAWLDEVSKHQSKRGYLLRIIRADMLDENDNPKEV